MEKVQALKSVADNLGCSQAALAMAWVLKNPNVSSAITGASKPDQITESVKALEIVPKLDDKVMAEIENILGNKPEPVQRRFA